MLAFQKRVVGYDSPPASCGVGTPEFYSGGDGPIIPFPITYAARGEGRDVPSQKWIRGEIQVRHHGGLLFLLCAVMGKIYLSHCTHL